MSGIVPFFAPESLAHPEAFYAWSRAEAPVVRSWLEAASDLGRVPSVMLRATEALQIRFDRTPAAPVPA